MKTKAIPEGFHSLIPDLVVRDAAEAIEFYKRVFDAKKRRVFHGPDGNIIHAEIQILLVSKPDSATRSLSCSLFRPIPGCASIRLCTFPFLNRITVG
jgi:hypothetical protein